MLHKGRGADTDTSHTLLGLINPGNMICLENNGTVVICQYFVVGEVFKSLDLRKHQL